MPHSNTDHPIKKAASKADKQFCPDCNTVMVIAEQFVENDIQYTWYECSRDNCSGQWLQREILFFSE